MFDTSLGDYGNYHVALYTTVMDRGQTHNIERVYMTNRYYSYRREGSVYMYIYKKGTKVRTHYNKGRMGANVQ